MSDEKETQNLLSGIKSASTASLNIDRDQTPPLSPAIRRRHNHTLMSEGTFRCEDGAMSEVTDKEVFMRGVHLENPEMETRWYFRYFLGQAHENYATQLVRDDKNETVILSLTAPQHPTESTYLKAILWRQTGSEHMSVRFGDVSKASKGIDLRKVILAFGRGQPGKNIVLIQDEEVQRHLLLLEEQEGAVNFKIGILYAKKGQMTDDDMFSNEGPSPAFEKFYEAMGTKVELNGFEGFRGGLDVKNGSTGTHSVHTVEFGKEIMFHVSTLLPYTEGNRQQLERKRHLGNDICNIIFQEDEETVFDPEQIKSQFNHIFAVVYLLKDGSYKLNVLTKQSVPDYGPEVPNPPVFEDIQQLRTFLIVKLMNGEKAALASRTASFANKKERTLAALIFDIAGSTDLLGRSSSKKSTRFTKSQYGHEGSTIIERGQKIKLDKIQKGIAPTSSLSQTSMSVGEPWEAVYLTRSFEHKVFAGDFWGQHVIAASDGGVFQIFNEPHEAGDIRKLLLIDGSISFRSVIVDEGSELVFLCSGKPGDKKVAKQNLFIVPFHEFENPGALPLKKKTIKKYLLSAAKGLHLFDVNLSTATTANMMTQTCKLAVAVGKKVRTFQMVASDAKISWSMLDEYTCGESIECLAVGKGLPGNPGQVCVGLKSGEFLVFDLRSSDVSSLLAASNVPGSVSPYHCQQIVEDDEDDTNEYLLGYNAVSAFKNTKGENTRQFEIHWRSKPKSLVYVYPYLLAFTDDAVLISTMINGNLVKSLQMTDVQLLSGKRDVLFCTETAEGVGLVYMLWSNLSGKRLSLDEFESLPRHSGVAITARKLSMTEHTLIQRSRLAVNSNSSSKADLDSNGGLPKVTEAKNEG